MEPKIGNLREKLSKIGPTKFLFTLSQKST